MTESPAGGVRRSRTATHWGSYDVLAEGGRVTEVVAREGDADPSPIGLGMPRALDDKSRILRPAVRRGWLEEGPRAAGDRRGQEPFVEVSWEEVVELVGAELERVRREHGNQAIFGGSYGWGSAGRVHHAQSLVHRFLGMLGGYTSSINTYSTGALEVVLPHVIGGSPWSILERSPVWSEVAEAGQLVLAFGGLPLKNSQVNSGGLGRHVAAGWQRRCREAGVEFVNVSPLAADAAEFLEAEWVAPRPNTDVALMLGLAHTLVVENLHDRAFLERCCTGFERFRAYLLGEVDGVAKSAEWAAAIAEVDAGWIEATARKLASRRTLITTSWSLQRADHGEQTCWMGVTLAAMSGSMGLPGGGYGAGLSAEDGVGSARRRWSVAAMPQPANQVEDFIPVSRIADMLLHPGEPYDYDGRRLEYPDIRLVYWCGGNPFHHHQDLNRLAAAWQRPETVIVHEPWWNPLARFSDIVLPAATSVEREDLACGAYQHWISAMEKAVELPGEALTDFEIFSRLATRLGFGDEFTEGRTAEEWVRHLYEETRASLSAQGVELPTFEQFWSAGEVEMPQPPVEIEGDFGALRLDPQAHPLGTPSGKIEIYSETVAGFGYDDCPGHPVWREPREWQGGAAARFPLHLLSNQPRHRLHSQYDNGAYSQAAKVGGREPVLINPADATPRGIAADSLVRLYNDRGACLAGAVLSETVRPGTVCLSTGAWFDPVGAPRAGGLDAHGNPNTLTPDRGTSRLAQGCSAHSALVEVERFDEEPPPVRAFEPPPLVGRQHDG